MSALILVPGLICFFFVMSGRMDTALLSVYFANGLLITANRIQ